MSPGNQGVFQLTKMELFQWCLVTVLSFLILAPDDPATVIFEMTSSFIYIPLQVIFNLTFVPRHDQVVLSITNRTNTEIGEGDPDFQC
jgi:hypothetical protein